MATTTKAPPTATTSTATRPAAPQAAAPRLGQPSKYDGLVNAGAISKAALQDCLAKRGDKDGTIEQLLVKSGSQVSAGDLLLVVK